MENSVSELIDLWGRVLTILEEEFRGDPQVYESFFKDSYVHSAEGKTLLVAVNSKLAVQIIEKMYAPKVRDAVNSVTQSDYSVIFMFKDEIAENQKISPAKPLYFSDSFIDPNYTFDNFVDGVSNREARQAALMVSQNPGHLFNPLLIYGDSGLGKTHLLHAIGNAIKNKYPNLKILYVHAQDFLKEYVKFVSADTDGASIVDWFRDEVDVLLIDDVQFLAKKVKTEETFFSIYNSFYGRQKQVVLTCDQHPSKVNDLDERLKSRFVQGLPICISQPDRDTAERILKLRIEANGLAVEDFDAEVITFMAETFRKNVRELEGAFQRLLFMAVQSSNPHHITLEMAKNAVGELVDVKNAMGTLSSGKIIDTVADYYSIPAYQLTGKARTSQVALARHIAMYLIRSRLDVPFTKIGQMFGGRDHATVMNGVNKVENSLKVDKNLQKAISELNKRLK